jgi:uncharacterized oxidoreductase
MQLEGNSILITGGASGIGRGLAEALHRKGNQVVIAGRRKELLQQVASANPGMRWVELNLEDPDSIAKASAQLLQQTPELNVLINNAGIMQVDDVSTHVDDRLLESTVATNLLGPIRLTGALIEHFKRKKRAAVINNSSILAFVPLALAAVYSATKAAIHSYSLSLRHKLKGSSVRVVEIAPPWVRTDLLGSTNEPRAMPLADFITETMHLLETDVDEVLVNRAMQFRNNPGPNEAAFVNAFNGTMAGVRTH